MANALATLFGDIAAAIKAKNGEQDIKYKPIEFPGKILALKVGESSDKKLAVANGEFQITTAGVRKITHNLGVTPDIVMYFLAYLDGNSSLTSSSGVLTGEVAYSAEMIADGAERMYYLINGGSMGAPFGINENAGIENPIVVHDANPEWFKLGSANKNYFFPNAKYRWVAIGGLKEHNEFYTVRFYDGETLLKTETVKFGTVLTPPEPEKEGYALDGWTPALSKVTGDVDYTANWIENYVVVESGTCGDNAIWELTDTGKMIVSGTGTIKDYSYQGEGPFFQKTFETLVIKSGITRIGKYAFPQCKNITSVKIADTVTEIGQYAFQSCHGLQSITIPDSVTKIEGSAFTGCIALESITLSKNLTFLGNQVFSDCVLTSLTIPASVTKIGQYMCTSTTLRAVVFENTSGWHITSNSSYTGGGVVDVTNAETAASYFSHATYKKYYWYVGA
jgi:hypothetical protein